MNILSDEFNVSGYIHGLASRCDKQDMSRKADEAKVWEKEAMRHILIPDHSIMGEFDDIEKKWIEFNSMPKKHRRESDWKSIELFGMTNQDTYDAFRSEYLKQDFDTSIEKLLAGCDIDSLVQEGASVSDGYIDDYEAGMYSDDQPVEYSTLEVEEAIQWAENSNRVIIVPTRTLDELEDSWTAFNSMVFNHRQQSDDRSIALFGLTNLKHYEYLKKQFLDADISDDKVQKYSSMVESCDRIVNYDNFRYIKEIAATQPKITLIRSIIDQRIPLRGTYEAAISNNLISGVTSVLDTMHGNLDTGINHGDLPYYTPDEIVQMQNTFADYPDPDNVILSNGITVQEWFEQYKALYDGFYTEYAKTSPLWVTKVRELMHGLERIKESGSEYAIKARMRSIYELGWNPNIPFTEKARKIATYSINEAITNRNPSNCKVIDLRGFSSNHEIPIYESENAKTLFPIYITLTEGNSTFSSVIKNMTKSVYSHASIAFDPDLKKMYSFGIENKVNKGGKGGFRDEDVADVPNGGHLTVHVFFVGAEPYRNIKDWVMSLEDNIAKTSYGYKNLLWYLFKIPGNTNDYSMFCSQFVDRCLKLADIDITGSKSLFVAPEDLNKAAKSEKRIYLVYEGLASNYNGTTVRKLIDSLTRTAIPLKEHTVYLRDMASYLTGLSSNLYNVSFIREMRHHLQNTIPSNYINNPIKGFLHEHLFDSLEIRDYMEGCTGQTPITIDQVNAAIEKFIPSL